MVLLSRMMRSVAVTGRTDHVHNWVAGRQAGEWAERTMRAGLPRADTVETPPADPEATLRQLTQLHATGVLTAAEFEALRARAGV